jgi:alkaline phosphatase D
LYDNLVARLSRRQLMNAAAIMGAGAIAAPIVSRKTQAAPIFMDYPFQLGVASGDPLPNGVVLWTRLAPKHLEGGGMPAVNVEVQWDVSTTTNFANLVQSGTAIARPELGHAVHAEVTGLEPNREYFYRFRAGAEVTPTARTKTAPAAGANVDRLRFGLCGCNNYQQGFFTAYKGMADERFDFIIHTGDYIYEGRDDGNRSPPETVVRRHNGQEIMNVVDYRNRYGLYKSDPNFIAAHASAPWLMTHDDHEVENNYTGEADENNIPPEIFALRKAMAYQAYYENQPFRAAQLPRNGSQLLYRRLQFGNLMDISLLDTRQYRSDQPCNDGSRTGCAGINNPNATMLGAEQERWLFDNLANARAKWTILSQQVPIYMRDFIKAAPEGQFSMDKWDAYTVARSRLMNRLKETQAPNPVALSGDVHQAYAADLKMDYRNPTSETVGVEFTGTSIASGGDGTEVAATWDTVKGDNPHIKYNSAKRGYTAFGVTQTEMRAEHKIVERVTVPNQPIRLGATAVVVAGKPGIQMA